VATRICWVPHEYHLLQRIAQQVWASQAASLRSWQRDDLILFKAGKDPITGTFAAVASVVGRSYAQKQSPIWEEDEHIYRIPIQFIHLVPVSQRSELTKELRESLQRSMSDKWITHVLTNTALPGSIGSALFDRIGKYPDVLPVALEFIGPLLSREWAERHDLSEDDEHNPHATGGQTIPSLFWSKVFDNPNPSCPRCHSGNTRRIRYGLPIEPLEDTNPYEVAGGCCPTPAQWICYNCKHEWPTD